MVSTLGVIDGMQETVKHKNLDRVARFRRGRMGMVHGYSFCVVRPAWLLAGIGAGLLLLFDY